MEKQQLSQGEWQIMQLLWAKPHTLMELVAQLGTSIGWSKSTVATMVRRMEAKGLITYDTVDRAKRFSPALPREEAAILLDNRTLLEQYGYEVEDFGDGTVLIRQIPSDLDESQAAAALQELAGNLLEGRAKDPAALRDDLLHTIACKAAIKAGWHSDEKELLVIAEAVMAREDLKYCPHGRPICVTLSKKQLEKQFKRS